MKTKTLLSICVMGLLTPCTYAQTMFQVNEDFLCPRKEENVGNLNHQNESLSDIEFNKKNEKFNEVVISDRYKRYVSDEVIP